MHVLQVVPYVSYPPRMGGDHRSHGLVKEFPEMGDTVYRYCQGGSPGMYKDRDLRRRVEIAEGYVEYRHLHPLHEAAKAPMLLGYPNLLAEYSLRLADDGLPHRIEEADVVMIREPWQFRTVYRMVPEDTPVVLSSHNVETERFARIDQPLAEDWTIERVRALEQFAVDHADAIVVTSERDSRTYREDFDSDVPHVVAPNGTYEDDIREHRPDSPGAKRVRERYGIPPDATVCLFMGSNYRPNVEAAQHVLDIAREVPAVEFIVMGSVGNALSRREVPENVTVTGYVEEDFEAHFDASDVALNPMTSGGGTNIKLLDYFARSLPVVSTEFGVRGMDVDDQFALLISDIDDFSEQIRVLSESRNVQDIVDAGNSNALIEKYTWENSSIHLNNELNHLH